MLGPWAVADHPQAAARDAAVSRTSLFQSQERFDSRSALGRRVCEEFSLFDAAGRLRLAGCMKALAVLAGSVPGTFLSLPKMPAVTGGPGIVEAGVPEPVGVPPNGTLFGRNRTS